MTSLNSNESDLAWHRNKNGHATHARVIYIYIYIYIYKYIYIYMCVYALKWDTK